MTRLLGDILSLALFAASVALAVHVLSGGRLPRPAPARATWHLWN